MTGPNPSKGKINVGLAVIARKLFDMNYVNQMLPLFRKALESDDATVDLKGPLFTTEDAEQAARALATQGCDLLVILTASFADATPVAAIASSLHIPTLLWATAEPPSESGWLRLNSYCGAMLAGNALTALGRPFVFVYGSPEDPATRAELQTQIRAQAARKLLGNARIGLLGVRPGGYYPSNFDEMELRRVIGPTVEYVSLAEVLKRAPSASSPEEAALLVDLKKRIIGLETVPSPQVEGTIRSYLAIRDLARERRFDGVAVRCWPEFFEEGGHAVCGAISRLIDHGIMAGCEADVNATATMLALHRLSGEASFTVDIIAADAQENTWTLYHCGAGPLSLASPSRPVKAGYQPNRKLGLAFWFAMKPGPVTISRLSFMGGKYRLLLTQGEAIDRPPRFSMGSTALVRMDGDAMAGAKKMVELGFEHHVAMTYGDHGAELEALAKSWGIEVVRI